MRTSLADAQDTWILQERVVYTFQQTQITQRLPHLRRQNHQTLATQDITKAPEVVLLSLWPQATAQQIFHYTSGYRVLYPTTKVVLLRNDASKFKNKDPDYDNALDELVDARSLHEKHTVLLHLFGTSGASGACRLLRGYRLRTGAPLNVGAVVADTEPSSSITTFLTSSQPISSAFFTFLLAFWMALQEYMWFLPLDRDTGQIHQDLNNPFLLPKEARKCFIFAQRGLMLTWMKRTLPKPKYNEPYSFELNDEPDERREYAIKRSSIDQQGRWSGDQERYWSGIEGVWEGR